MDLRLSNLSNFVQLQLMPSRAALVSALQSDSATDLKYAQGNIFECYWWLYLGASIDFFPPQETEQLIRSKYNLFFRAIMPYIDEDRHGHSSLRNLWRNAYQTRNPFSTIPGTFPAGSEIDGLALQALQSVFRSALMLAGDLVTDKNASACMTAMSFADEMQWKSMLGDGTVGNMPVISGSNPRFPGSLETTTPPADSLEWWLYPGRDWSDRAHVERGFLSLLDFIAVSADLFQIVTSEIDPADQQGVPGEEGPSSELLSAYSKIGNYAGVIMRWRLDPWDQVVENRFIDLTSIVGRQLSKEASIAYLSDAPNIFDTPHFVQYSRDLLKRWRSRATITGGVAA